MAAGLLWLGFIPVEGTYLGHVLPPLVTIAIGMGLAFVSGTIAATTGGPPSEAAAAAAQQVQTAALVDGFHAAFFARSGLAVFGAAAALVLVKQRKGEKIKPTIAAPA